MNSTSEALALGVPLLVYPQSVEQSIIAQRVEELDAGRTIRDRDATPRGIGDAVSAALAGGHRDAARSIARSFEEAGGAAAAVDAIEELIAGSKPRRST
jgi:UDP:flavonoid glycosyltransferase YjiC (YdhE family)